ncbi:MAG TPA: YbdD/YjiX family protein [Gemmatimonadales bacterium]|nr:YbdD/YjiX family protein [Gemmatimonadales bacterium]
MLASLLQALRRIAGMPDYQTYVTHLRQCHPEQIVPTERQFYEDFLRTRYEGGPTRCC